MKFEKKSLIPAISITRNYAYYFKKIIIYFIHGAHVTIKGINSKIEINRASRIKSTIRIIGNNNALKIGSNCRFIKTTVDIISNQSTITIGDNTNITGNHLAFTHILAKGDGTSIDVGRGCLFSYGIEIRTTDSHSIFTKNGNQLINPPRSIAIGANVWIGAKAFILKGSTIGNGSIIAAASIVNSNIGENILAAGIPAKPKRSEIRWTHTSPQNTEHTL